MVRCTHCGAAVSVWAARCPNCHAEMDDAVPIVEQRPVAPAIAPQAVEVTALPRHRSQAQVRRVVIALMVLAAIGAVAVTRTISHRQPGGSASRGSDSLLGSPALDAYTVIYTGAHGVRAVGLDGRSRGSLFDSKTGPPLQTSAGVVFVHAGTAYLLPPPFTGPPRPLVPADGLVPMLWPGTVGAERRVGWGVFNLRYVDLDGGNPSDSPGWRLPAGYVPVGQFLVLGPELALRSWQPSPGGQASLGQVIGHASAVVGSQGSKTVWLAVDCCNQNGESALHLSDTSTSSPAEDRIIPPPAGHRGYLPGAALSPDGALIAAFVAEPGDGTDRAQLVIVDTATSHVTVIPDSTITIGNGVACAHWTPDGSYLLFSGPKGLMHAYRPGDTGATTLHITGSDSFTVD